MEQAIFTFFFFFLKGQDGVGCEQFVSSVLKQISPFQTSTDKIIRHSEHNSVLYSATKDSSLVSLHLLSQGCDASIITLSKRAGLERQKHSFRTLTVCMKWSALIRILQKMVVHFHKGHLESPTLSLKTKTHWFCYQRWFKKKNSHMTKGLYFLRTLSFMYRFQTTVMECIQSGL